ncbi:hypothetical protein AWH62_11400 [Maricaulis sp. W15]|uniref:class I SAM-dependent methyltransferase n=1 Tax=Maricaulis sp. W15 TaxID=1772333 RepID=UPI000948EEFC|nr:DUF1698 domain-containing protein [Maricaulis sp. W15]OLF71738.1 hypothetical protein AWH62_11400 [Maricaulis sp. W15]
MAVFKPKEGYAERVTARMQALQAKFDEAFSVTSPQQQAELDILLAQIGTVDWEGEGYQSPERQRDLSIKYCWGHNHRFGDDQFVKGRMGDRHVRLISEFTEGFELPDDFFKGRSVLDIGCWTGGTTLMLKLLGATQVVAVDEVRKYANTAHALASRVFELPDVEGLALSLYDLEEGKFDCVYVPGVVYHLSDPVLGLRRLFNRLKDGGHILVESAGIQHEQSMCWFKGNGRHFGGTADDLNRSGWAWFWPSAKCLEEWLYEAGFDDVRVFYSEPHDRLYAYGRRTRHQEITRAGLSVPNIE